MIYMSKTKHLNLVIKIREYDEELKKMLQDFMLLEEKIKHQFLLLDLIKEMMTKF